MGYGAAGKIASVTTISTPHAGTAVADHSASAPSGLLNPAGQFLAWLLGVSGGSSPPDDLGGDASSDDWTPDLAASIASLTPAAENDLVAQNPIPADIPFFTVAGVSNLRSLHNAECVASLWGDGDDRDDTTPLLAATGAYLSFTDDGTIDEPTPLSQGDACTADEECNPGLSGTGLLCKSGTCKPGCKFDLQCPGALRCKADFQCR